jgi:hypothetical protein
MKIMPRVNIAVAKKRGRGRPRKLDALTTIVPVALSAALADKLDAWAEANAMASRSSAARSLIERGLAAPAPRRKGKSAS